MLSRIIKIKKILADARKRQFLILRTLSNFLIIFAVFGLLVTFAPIIISEIDYQYQQFMGVEYEVRDDTIIRSYKEDSANPFNSLLRRDLPVKERIAPASAEFGIIIPKIGANARIISNVDASNRKEYNADLMKGVAHAQGTSFPGEKKKIYLFAHSTDNWWNINRYNAVFFLLKELKQGDQIDIFYKGRRYAYKATEINIVEATEVKYLVEPSNEEILVLQTCWPPGTTLKRLIVTAKPLSNIAEN